MSSRTLINNNNIHDLVDKYLKDKSQLPPDLARIPIGNWNVSQVTNMQRLFGDENFNEPLNGWDVSNVTNMLYMFVGCERFNQPLDAWNVSNAETLSYMFYDCNSFNQSLNSWNVSNVVNMAYMFIRCTSFNQPLNDWDVSNVTNMAYMFSECLSFNQPLNSWNVSNVVNMTNMFNRCASFNQPLNQWDVSEVTNMRRMFFRCTNFNQRLRMWNVENVTDFEDMFDDCPISEANKPDFVDDERENEHDIPQNEVDPYEIHHASSKINYTKLNDFLRSHIGTQMPANINYPQYIRETVTNIIQTGAGSEDEKFEIIVKLIRIMNERLNLFNYSEISPVLRETIFSGLEYVKLQTPEFKHAYADEFTHVCVTAYTDDGNDGMTCAKGAIERIIMALVVACKAMILTDGSPANPEHEQLVDIITSNPETLIPEYIKDWYKEHKMGTDGAFAENATVDEKRASLRAFLLTKFPEEEETGLIDRKIALFADTIGYDADDFMYGGTRRRRRWHHKYMRTRKTVRKGRKSHKKRKTKRIRKNAKTKRVKRMKR